VDRADTVNPPELIRVVVPVVGLLQATAQLAELPELGVRVEVEGIAPGYAAAPFPVAGCTVAMSW
jgi:hypothetical protein